MSKNVELGWSIGLNLTFSILSFKFKGQIAISSPEHPLSNETTFHLRKCGLSPESESGKLEKLICDVNCSFNCNFRIQKLEV